MVEEDPSISHLSPSTQCYEGRSINKLQKGVVSLILKISKIRNIRCVGTLFWNTLWESVNNDDTVVSLSYQTINMAALPLKSSCTEQCTVVKTVDSLGLEVLPHPPYNPDLAPSDDHFFDSMKKMLGGQKFAWEMEVQWAVRQWLAEQPTLFFFCIGHS